MLGGCRWKGGLWSNYRQENGEGGKEKVRQGDESEEGKKNIGGFGALVVVDVSRRLHDPTPRIPHSFSGKMKT